MPPTTTDRPSLRPLADAAEHAAALDDPAARIAGAVRRAVPEGGPREALSGTWLGHALHPLLTDAVIGTWLSASLLDVLGEPRAADRLVVIGALCSLPTAVTGASDWADAEPADPRVRRVGAVHAVANVAALGLQVASLRARRRGTRGRGIALSLVANAAVGVSGFLGGHLAFARGVGVDETTFDAGPDDWTPTVMAAALDGRPNVALAGDTPVLLVRREGRVLAIHDRCSHRGCSLAAGEIEGTTVRCACHGSRFSLEDGRILQGPATAPQPAFETREADGRIEVRRRPG